MRPRLAPRSVKLDSNLPTYFGGTPARLHNEILGVNRITATLFTIFGLVAVVLSSVGLYGVMSFAVSQRTQEFGIRMALGANAARILRMVMTQGARQLVIGLVLGGGSIALLLKAAGSEALRRTSSSTLTRSIHSFIRQWLRCSRPSLPLPVLFPRSAPLESTRWKRFEQSKNRIDQGMERRSDSAAPIQGGAICNRPLKHTRFPIAQSGNGSVVDVRYKKRPTLNVQLSTSNEGRGHAISRARLRFRIFRFGSSSLFRYSKFGLRILTPTALTFHHD